MIGGDAIDVEKSKLPIGGATVGSTHLSDRKCVEDHICECLLLACASALFLSVSMCGCFHAS